MYKKVLNTICSLLLSMTVIVTIGCSPKESTSSEQNVVSEDPVVIRESLMEDIMSQSGITQEQADHVVALLDSLGVGNMKLMSGPSLAGTTLIPLRGIVRSNIGPEEHQVNFTLDNGNCFYVMITGFKAQGHDFDLYDSDTVQNGYIAYYDPSTDQVIKYVQ